MKHQDYVKNNDVHRTPEIVKFLRIGENFDKIAFKLYKANDLSNFNDIFNYRIYTHNDTELCKVYSYHLRQHPELETPMPNCLRCLAHALRYGDKYVQSLILKSVVMSYDGINMHSIVKKASQEALYEFGLAIVEAQGIYGVFDTYINMLDVSLAVKIQAHPLLHKLLLTDDVLKRRVYREFKARKRIFYEEMYAKAWHPSRFMQWCLDNEEKKEMDIPDYKFQKTGSLWNIVW